MSRVSKPRKHGKRWQISFYDASGQRRWRSFPSFKDAQVALRGLQAEADAARRGASSTVTRPSTIWSSCGWT